MCRGYGDDNGVGHEVGNRWHSDGEMYPIASQNTQMCTVTEESEVPPNSMMTDPNDDQQRDDFTRLWKRIPVHKENKAYQ